MKRAETCSFYVINYTYLYHHIVVLDKYTHSNLVYYKHNGDDKPYEEADTRSLLPSNVDVIIA